MEVKGEGEGLLTMIAQPSSLCFKEQARHGGWCSKEEAQYGEKCIQERHSSKNGA